MNPEFLHVRLFSQNEGLFKSLLRFVTILSNDTITHEYLESLKLTNKRSTTFVSRQFINRVMINVKKYILNNIGQIIEGDCGGKFGIMMDSTTDTSTTNQCSLVVRFVTKCLTIVNRTIAFTPAIAHRGQDLFNIVKAKLNDVNLQIQNCIGSSTDGASNMYSENVGLSAFLQNANEDHIYMWCACHRFQLGLEHVFSRHKFATSLWTNVNTFAKFIRKSTVRTADWRKKVVKLGQTYHDIHPRIKPATIASTRWWSKQKVIKSMVKSPSCMCMVYIMIVNSLKVAPKKLKNEKLIPLSQFWFKSYNILMVFAMDKILTTLRVSSDNLQRSTISIGEIIPIIQSCYQSLNELADPTNPALSLILEGGRSFVQTVHERCSGDEVQILIGKQGNKIDLITDAEMTAAKECIIEIVNDLLVEFEKLFLDGFTENEDFYKEISVLMPENVLKLHENTQISLKHMAIKNKIDEKSVVEKFRKFAADFQSIDNGEVTGKEMLCRFFSSKENQEKHSMVNKMYQYMYTIPCTQVECERNFSILKIIKTPTRSTLNDVNLESSMLIKLNADMIPKSIISKIIDDVAHSSAKLRTKLLPKVLPEHTI